MIGVELPKHARIGHPGQVYICSTRRRKPGVCTNTLALPIDDTDDTVLEIIEGEVLGTKYIRELLALVDRGEVDDTVHLTADRDRLRGEVDNLVKSIAAGVPPQSVAPGIAERESQIATLDARLRRPRHAPPNGNGTSAPSRRSHGWWCDGWSRQSCCTMTRSGRSL